MVVSWDLERVEGREFSRLAERHDWMMFGSIELRRRLWRAGDEFRRAEPDWACRTEANRIVYCH